MIQSIGTYSTYHTHRLVREAGRKADDEDGGSRTAVHCVCESHLKDYEAKLVNHLESFYLAANATHERFAHSRDEANRVANLLRLASYPEFYFSRLEPTRAIDEDGPFMIIRVEPDIIKDHSDLFNER